MIERVRRRWAKAPKDVKEAADAVFDHPKAPEFWAWYADQCGIYDVPDTYDPQELAFANGLRAAFFMAFDVSSTDRRDIQRMQERIDQQGGNYA